MEMQVKPDTEAKTDTDAKKARFDFILRVHVYVNEYIRFADTKAAVILSGCSFLFSVPILKSDSISKIAKTSGSLASICFSVLAVSLLIALGWTIFWCIKCLLPNLESSPQSMVYFGNIAAMKAAKVDQEDTRASRMAAFEDYALSIEPEESIKQFAIHVFELSAIATEKFVCVRKATGGFGCVLVLTVLFGFSLIFIGK